MTTFTPVPKPQPRTDADKRAARIASVQKLERSRRKPLPRSTISAARKPIAKKRRTKAEDLRIYGSREFRTFLRSHACLGCGYRGEAIQQAHVHTGGMGRKDDWTRTGPLCGPHRVSRGWLVDYVSPGCHHAYDAAKRSWRTGDGQTFATAQREFFERWQRQGAA